MNANDAVNMLAWTRDRTLKILDVIPPEFLVYKPKETPKNSDYKKPRAMLAHIVGVENYWVHEKILKNPLDTSIWSFPGKSIDQIRQAMSLVRRKTLDWLEKDLAMNLDVPYSERAKTNMSFILHHVGEHEAHHLGQICLLATLADVKIPWV